MVQAAVMTRILFGWWISGVVVVAVRYNGFIGKTRQRPQSMPHAVVIGVQEGLLDAFLVSLCAFAGPFALRPYQWIVARVYGAAAPSVQTEGDAP